MGFPDEATGCGETLAVLVGLPGLAALFVAGLVLLVVAALAAGAAAGR